MITSEALAVGLARHGVTLTFSQCFPVRTQHVAPKYGIRQIGFRTENAGGYMADGYARVSRRIAVLAAREALACGAAHAITDADDLVRQIDRLLTDVACREQMSQAGREFAARHRGATEHTLELISSSISSTVR